MTVDIINRKVSKLCAFFENGVFALATRYQGIEVLATRIVFVHTEQILSYPVFWFIIEFQLLQGFELTASMTITKFLLLSL